MTTDPFFLLVQNLSGRPGWLQITTQISTADRPSTQPISLGLVVFFFWYKIWVWVADSGQDLVNLPAIQTQILYQNKKRIGWSFCHILLT